MKEWILFVLAEQWELIKSNPSHPDLQDVSCLCLDLYEIREAIKPRTKLRKELSGKYWARPIRMALNSLEHEGEIAKITKGSETLYHSFMDLDSYKRLEELEKELEIERITLKTLFDQGEDRILRKYGSHEALNEHITKSLTNLADILEKIYPSTLPHVEDGR